MKKEQSGLLSITTVDATAPNGKTDADQPKRANPKKAPKKTPSKSKKVLPSADVGWIS